MCARTSREITDHNQMQQGETWPDLVTWPCANTQSGGGVGLGEGYVRSSFVLRHHQYTRVNCVIFPESVSPTMTTTPLSLMMFSSSCLTANMGRYWLCSLRVLRLARTPQEITDHNPTYLSQLCGLSGARLPYNDHHAIVPDDVQQLVPHSKYGQVLALFFEGLALRKLAGSLCLLLHVICELLLRLVVDVLFIVL